MKQEKSMMVMRLYSGTDFDPLTPDNDSINVEDFAHALSLMCRGNGQVKHFYSVGQHSINCADLAKDLGYSTRVQLACLLHDASEGYIADITRPVKRHLPKYLTIEEVLQEAIYEKYGLGDLTDDERIKIKEVDDTMLRYELYHLLAIEEMKDQYPAWMRYPLAFTLMQEIEKTFIEYFRRLEGA